MKKKRIFKKAESKKLNVGDILVFGGHTFHKGGKYVKLPKNVFTPTI